MPIEKGNGRSTILGRPWPPLPPLLLCLCWHNYSGITRYFYHIEPLPFIIRVPESLVWVKNNSLSDVSLSLSDVSESSTWTNWWLCPCTPWPRLLLEGCTTLFLLESLLFKIFVVQALFRSLHVQPDTTASVPPVHLSHFYFLQWTDFLTCDTEMFFPLSRPLIVFWNNWHTKADVVSTADEVSTTGGVSTVGEVPITGEEHLPQVRCQLRSQQTKQ